jgi:phage repressor protein C with HTH and peptisase S24 domain
VPVLPNPATQDLLVQLPILLGGEHLVSPMRTTVSVYNRLRFSYLHNTRNYDFVKKFYTFYSVCVNVYETRRLAMVKQMETMIGFWKRVKEALADDEYNQAWLCRELDIPTGTMSTWITHDRLPKADLAAKIAKLLGVTVEYLVFGDEEENFNEQLGNSEPINGSFITPSQKEFELSSNQKVIAVPILNQKVSAGPGENVFNELPEPEQYLPVLAHLVSGFDANALRVVEVKGDSMTGVQLFGGDLVVFAANHIDSNGIYVISIGGEAMVKRLEFDRFNNLVKVKSENKQYDPIIIPADHENLRIEGKVVGWYHRHPY